jgi:hypothetical protein
MHDGLQVLAIITNNVDAQHMAAFTGPTTEV